jgi:sugar/nucleoside kinase (ribokinase family)
MNAEQRQLCVVGYIHLEVCLPLEQRWPAAGEEVFVPAIDLRLGGALNTASVARALGLPVVLAYPVGYGGLSKAAIDNTLVRLGIAPRPWPARADPAISIVLANASERSFVSATDFAALADCPALPACGWIHVAGLIEAEGLAPRLAAARDVGARVSVAGSWAPDVLDLGSPPALARPAGTCSCSTRPRRAAPPETRAKRRSCSPPGWRGT